VQSALSGAKSTDKIAGARAIDIDVDIRGYREQRKYVNTNTEKKKKKIEEAESVERIDDNRGNRKQQTANGNDAFARVARSSPVRTYICMYTQKSELARSRQKLTVDSPGGHRGVE